MSAATTIASVLVAVAISSPSIALAQTESSPQLAVVIGLKSGLSSAEASGVSTAFARGLEAELIVDAITNQELKLPATGVPAECLSDVACMNKLSVSVDAEQLLLLVIVKVGNEIQVEPVWYGRTSNLSRTRPLIALPADASTWEAKVRERAREILPDARIRQKPVKAVGAGRSDVSRPSGFGFWTYTSFGVAVVGLAAAGFFGLAAIEADDDLKAMCPDGTCTPAEIAPLVDKRDEKSTWTDVFGVVSLVGVASAVGFYFYYRGREKPRSDFSVSVGRSAAAASWSVRF